MRELEIGSVYGAWLIKEKLPKKQKYRCQCTACGQTVQDIRVYDLTTGKTRQCRGCAVSASRRTHQLSRTTEYNTWQHIIQRCHNPNNKDYPNYGGRGIEVYPLWRDSFEAFYFMMGDKPEPHYTIERIDHNGNYEPGNVKWLPKEEQSLNKRDNVNLTIDGVTKTVSQWAVDSPVSGFTIYKRIDRGWSPKRAVFTPSRKRKK